MTKRERPRAPVTRNQSAACPTPMKHVYSTRKYALMVASRLQQHLGGVTARMRPYKCPGCRRWHLTSKPAVPGLA